MDNIKNQSDFEVALEKSLRSPVFKVAFDYQKSKFLNSGFAGWLNICPTNNIEHTVHIIAKKISLHIKIINSFIEYRDQYEKFILLGNYDNAQDILNHIRDKYGLSYWFIGNQMSLFSIRGRNDDLDTFYNTLSKQYLTNIDKRDLDIFLDMSSEAVPSQRMDFRLDAMKASVKQDSQADFEIINFFFRFSCIEDYNINYILRYFWQCNIIDIYNIFSRVAIYLSTNKKTELEILKNESNLIFDKIVDYKTLHLKRSQLNNIPQQINEQCIEELCHEYKKGNYEEAINISEEILNIFPQLASIYEIYFHSLLNLGRESSLPKNSIISKLSSRTLKYFKNHSSNKLSIERDIAAIRKLSYQFTTIDAFQFVTLITAKSFNSCLKNSANKIYNYIDKACIPLAQKNTINHHLYRCNDIAVYRRIKERGDYYLNQDMFNIAANIYQSAKEYPRHMQAEIIGKTVLCYFKRGDITNGVHILSGIITNNEFDIKRLDLREIYNIIKESSSEAIPCAEMIISVNFLEKWIEQDSHQTALAIDDFLDFYMLEKPSEIDSFSDKIDYVLFNILSLDVLESLHMIRGIYPTLSSIMLERVLILSKLEGSSDCCISPLVIIEEKKALAQQYAINLCITKISDGKLYINEQMILQEALIKSKSHLEDLVEHINTRKINGFNPTNTDIFKEDLNDEIFVLAYTILLIFRDTYTVGSKYSLDHSLNTDIRHNGIVPFLRSLFEQHSIICSKENDSYIDNAFLANQYRSILIDDAYRKMQDIVINFSSEIDKILNRIKSRYMHISTDDKDDNSRFFKIIIDQNDTANFLLEAFQASSINIALEKFIETLNDKTKIAMNTARVTLSTATSNELKKHLDNLKREIQFFDRNKKFIPKVNLVKNELDAKIKECCDWLAFSIKAGDDFKLSTPIDIASSFLEKQYPNVLIKNNTKIDSDIIINGIHLYCFIRMFMLVLENAVKRRKKQQSSEVNINIETDDNAGMFTINIENESSSIDNDAISTINAEINTCDVTAKANREVNSGIYKIKKLLTFDLSIENHIEIKTHQSYFNLEIKLKFKQLIANREHDHENTDR
ncbi:hypothetical protein ACTG1W_08615 [Aeromonas dhakensis]